MSSHDELIQQTRGMLQRGVVNSVDDSGDVQTATLNTGDDVTRSMVEVHQPYGLASLPPDANPSALVLSIGGDQGHQMSLQLWSEYRFGNLTPGETAVWHWGGSRFHLKNGGNADLIVSGVLNISAKTAVFTTTDGLVFNGPVTFNQPVTFANTVAFQKDVTMAGNLTVGGIVTGTGRTRGAL